MTDESSLFVLEVENGTAVPEAIRLSPGNEVPPMSVGLKGQWHVAGPGILDVHGYLHFDGADLYLRSASATHPFRLGEETVGGEWQRILPPCRIFAGELVLSFTIAHAGPSRAAGGAVRSFFSPRAFAASSKEPVGAPAEQPGLQTTRIEPLEAPPPALSNSGVVTRPTGPRGSPSAPSGDLPHELLATHVPSPVPPAPIVELSDDLFATRFDEAPLALRDQAIQEFAAKAVSATRLGDEGPAALSDPAFQELLLEAAGMTLVDRTRRAPIDVPAAQSPAPIDLAPSQSPAPVVRRSPSPAPIVQGSPSPAPIVQGSPSPAPIVPGSQWRAPIVSGSQSPAPIDVPPLPSPASSTKSSPPLAVALRESWQRTPPVQKAILLLLPFTFLALRLSMAPHRAPVRQHAAPLASSAASAATTSLLPPVVSAPPPPPVPLSPVGGKTRARMAADAVAAGAYADAVTRYEELALTYPDQLVYREAARILRAKLGGTADAASTHP